MGRAALIFWKMPFRLEIAPPLEMTVARPLQMYCVASVVIQEVMPKRSVTTELRTPINTAARSPANTDGSGPQPSVMEQLAKTTELNSELQPMERSISPHISAKASPIASAPINAQFRRIIRMFFTAKNAGLMILV